MMESSDAQAALRPLSRREWGTYVLIVAVAAFLRLIQLDSIPPGLWYDEAIYALDGLDVARGKLPMFFETEGHMREPLYIYSLGGFFALFGSSTLHARMVSALWGIATVALLFPVARRIFGVRWGLLATGVFATFRWHLHFSRTIFRALLPAFFLLLVVLFWMRWRERRRMLDAWLCGISLGAGMYTYLSFRLVPIIIVALVFWELAKRRMTWRQDWKGLAAIAAGALITFTPLGIDYLRHPVHFTGRTNEITMFEKTVKVRGADGVELERRVPKTVREAARDLAGNAWDVARMWTVKGDHVGKHNLPYAPVFDWANGCVFYAGLAWCLGHCWRNPAAFLTLVWIFVLSMTSVFSFGAPNLLRMQGMTPAVIIAYMFGLRWLSELLSRFASGAVRRLVVGALVALFVSLQLYTYFVKFPASLIVRREFTADIYYEPAEGVRRAAAKYKKVLVPQELAATPTFRFVTAEFENVRAYEPMDEFTSATLNGAAVLVTARSLQLAQDAGQKQLSQLIGAGATRVIKVFTLPLEGKNGREVGLQKWGELRAITMKRDSPN